MPIGKNINYRLGFLYSLFSYFEFKDNENIVLPSLSFYDFLKAVLTPEIDTKIKAEDIILKIWKYIEKFSFNTSITKSKLQQREINRWQIVNKWDETHQISLDPFPYINKETLPFVLYVNLRERRKKKVIF